MNNNVIFKKHDLSLNMMIFKYLNLSHLLEKLHYQEGAY